MVIGVVEHLPDGVACPGVTVEAVLADVGAALAARLRPQLRGRGQRRAAHEDLANRALRALDAEHRSLVCVQGVGKTKRAR